MKTPEESHVTCHLLHFYCFFLYFSPWAHGSWCTKVPFGIVVDCNRLIGERRQEATNGMICGHFFTQCCDKEIGCLQVGAVPRCQIASQMHHHGPNIKYIQIGYVSFDAYRIISILTIVIVSIITVRVPSFFCSSLLVIIIMYQVYYRYYLSIKPLKNMVSLFHVTLRQTNLTLHPISQLDSRHK